MHTTSCGMLPKLPGFPQYSEEEEEEEGEEEEEEEEEEEGCDHHLRRQWSLCSLSLQLDNWGGRIHACPPLDCPKRWQSDHTSHHPRRFTQLSAKSEKWNGETQTSMCQCSSSTFKNSRGCTALDMPERTEMTEQVDWGYKQPWHVACVLEDLKYLGAWDTTDYLRAQSQGHDTVYGLEERGVERGSARWSSFKGREKAIVSKTNIGTVSHATLGKLISERRGGAHMGFSERINTTLNWTELNQTEPNSDGWMNENLYIAHKKLPHKILRVHSARCPACNWIDLISLWHNIHNQLGARYIT